MLRLEGKVALVSGAAGGSGPSIPRALADEGAKVVIGDLVDEDGEALAKELAPAATYVRLDVTSCADWDVAVATAVDAYGRLDVLVNNAGISIPGPIDTYSRVDWDAIVDVNLTGVFNGIRATVPALREAGGGWIVEISPPAGLVAAHTLLQAAARDLVQYGIRVAGVQTDDPDEAVKRLLELAALPEAA
jgi:3alpha(or 20beta)-hydroxysteroid dehydrogenase